MRWIQVSRKDLEPSSGANLTTILFLDNSTFLTLADLKRLTDYENDIELIRKLQENRKKKIMNVKIEKKRVKAEKKL